MRVRQVGTDDCHMQLGFVPFLVPLFLHPTGVLLLIWFVLSLKILYNKTLSQVSSSQGLLLETAKDFIPLLDLLYSLGHSLKPLLVLP